MAYFRKELNFKNCPSCGIVQEYKYKESYKNALIRNSECKKCAGTKVGKIVGKLGIGSYNGIPNAWFNNKKLNAKDRGLDFTITIEYIYELYVKQGNCCALSGIAIGWNSYGQSNHSLSMDRINSNIGYIQGNIQLVHKHINKMKQNFADSLFIELSTKVADWNRNDKQIKN